MQVPTVSAVKKSGCLLHPLGQERKDEKQRALKYVILKCGETIDLQEYPNFPLP